MKKAITLIIAGILVLATMTGCGQKGFDADGSMTIMSREEGSGTRGAFIELFGIEQKDANGEKVDHTIETADITQSTGVMLTSVAGNTQAIGYVSLGSLNDTVKALQIDGAKPTAENIKNGSYKISRPFNIAAKSDLSEAATDFINYILSSDGQKIVQDNGYIPLDNPPAYSGTKPSGKITIAGSSSVTPVMEKLKEAYLKINTNASIEINQSDSTIGMNSAADGICDIGMASRGLKDSELEKGLTPTMIALDGIAVIVNKENTLTNLTPQQVMDIYTGNITTWSELIG